MEYKNPQIWLFAAAIIATSGLCSGERGKRPFSPSDSIIDLIDQDHVNRMIEARRKAEEEPRVDPYFQRNELGESEGKPMVVSVPDGDDSTELPRIDFRKVLKSSKNALVITKQQYLKEDWCRTETFVQKIREPGCSPTTIINKFCYGQCNSFYIPRGPRRHRKDDERPAFKSCAACQPKKVSWVTITLTCGPDKYKRKRIQKIRQCKCLPVGIN